MCSVLAYSVSNDGNTYSIIYAVIIGHPPLKKLGRTKVALSLFTLKYNILVYAIIGAYFVKEMKFELWMYPELFITTG